MGKPPATTTQYGQEGIFDFFGLPKELRNQIYSLLTESRVVVKPHDEHGQLENLQACIPAMPIPMMFTLCCLFKTEYEETFKRGLAITFKDLGAVIEPPAITQQFNRFIKAAVFILAFCNRQHCNGDSCHAVGDLGDHLDWIKTTALQLKNLKELEVKIYQGLCDIVPGEYATHSSFATHKLFDEFIAVSGIERIELFPIFLMTGGLEKNGWKAYESNQTPEAIWTKKYGWEKNPDLGPGGMK